MIFQLQVEHALDLDGAALALFINAGTGTPAPAHVCRNQARASRAVSSHALDPELSCRCSGMCSRRPPPPAFVLCVRENRLNSARPSAEAAEGIWLPPCSGSPTALASRKNGALASAGRQTDAHALTD